MEPILKDQTIINQIVTVIIKTSILHTEMIAQDNRYHNNNLLFRVSYFSVSLKPPFIPMTEVRGFPGGDL